MDSPMDHLDGSLASHYSACQILATIPFSIGLLVILNLVIKFARTLHRSFRLYVSSQRAGSQLDFVRRYGKWALITGSTDGIGLSIAKELAKRGMSILVVSRNATKLAATRAELESVPQVGEVQTIQIDLSDSSVDNFNRIQAEIRPNARDIGILVNNAGLYPDQFKQINSHDMDHLLDISNLNMLNPVHMTRMIMPGMLSRGRGLVVNVSSIAGSHKAPFMSLYAPTKCFLNAFTRQLQAEHAHDPIDIILLVPGMVQTKRMDNISAANIPAWFSASPDHYAKSAVNAISARYHEFAGTLEHEIIWQLGSLVKFLGLADLLFPLYLTLTFDGSRIHARSAQRSSFFWRSKSS